MTRPTSVTAFNLMVMVLFIIRALNARLKIVAFANLYKADFERIATHNLLFNQIKTKRTMNTFCSRVSILENVKIKNSKHTSSHEFCR